MKKQALNRKYNYPDADLYLQGIDCIRYAFRDLEQFQQYGCDAERLQKFKTWCEQFQALPSDDELIGDQMILTDKKYHAAERLKSTIRTVMTRVAMKYNNRSGRYRKFGTSKMGDMTDAQLIFCGRRVVRVSRLQIDFLADVGVNETLIGRIVEAVQDFENAVNLQQDRVADRDIAVERRIEQGNKIYDELVTLCEIGKDIWAEKDNIKYENYTLYESNNDQKIARKERLAEETTQVSV